MDLECLETFELCKPVSHLRVFKNLLFSKQSQSRAMNAVLQAYVCHQRQVNYEFIIRPLSLRLLRTENITTEYLM